MVIKTTLIILVIVVLMEDSASIRKTEEEKKEDEEIAKAVNATLAAEEKKKKEEEDEKKKRDLEKIKKEEDGTKDKKESKKPVKKDERVDVEKPGKQDKACPPCNSTHPSVDQCLPCPVVEDCPPQECDPCPGQEPCEECPEPGVCPPCRPCKPCGPCPMGNSTTETIPGCQCPEGSGLSLLAAMAVGACAGLMVTGVATVLGLILRYVPPTVSGFLILATIIILWYLCSHYPDTARELGGRAVALIREAALTLSHRAMAVIRRHQDQVGALIESNLFFRMSSMF
jgi:hypothetical protein